jgi:hypothetical protein
MFETLTAVAGMLAGAAPQIDMATVQKWARAEVASFHVDAVFDGWTGVSHQWGAAEGEVSDSLKVDFVWNLNLRKVVGDVKFSNGGSTVKGVRSSLKECPTPGMPSGYEHFIVNSAAQDFDARIVLKGERAYGAVQVPLDCPSSMQMKSSPAKTVAATEYLAIPDPRMLGVGETGNPNVVVSKDRKTFVVKANGWTYAYTPILAK